MQSIFYGKMELPHQKKHLMKEKTLQPREVLAWIVLVFAILLFGTGSAIRAASGDVEAGFDPNADDVNNVTAVQADGKILIGGFFLSVGGVPSIRRSTSSSAGVGCGFLGVACLFFMGEI